MYIWVIFDIFSLDVFYDFVYVENGVCGVLDVIYVCLVFSVFKYNWI